MIPGAFTSILLLVSDSILPFPSIGFPSASTTRPRRLLPTGTSTIVLVLLTFEIQIEISKMVFYRNPSYMRYQPLIF